MNLMNIINFLAVKPGGVDCSDLADVKPIVQFVYNTIKFIIPIAIVLLGSIDLFKAVIASKEDEIKAAQKLLIKRVIYGVVIFVLATLVGIVFSSIGGDKAGIQCFFQ